MVSHMKATGCLTRIDSFGSPFIDPAHRGMLHHEGSTVQNFNHQIGIYTMRACYDDQALRLEESLILYASWDI